VQASRGLGTGPRRRTDLRRRRDRYGASSSATSCRASETSGCRRFAPSTSTPATASFAEVAGTRASRSRPAPCTGCTSSCTGLLPRRFAGNGSGSIRQPRRHRRRVSRHRSIRQAHAKPRRSGPTARHRGCHRSRLPHVLGTRRLDRGSTKSARGAPLGRRRPRAGTDRVCSRPARCQRRSGAASAKTRRTYRVNLDRNCLELLVAHHARARRRADCSGVDIDRSSFVFSNEPDGATPWRPNWVTKRFITYLHDLRHFMATPVSPRESRSQGIQGGLPS